jgi:hypothetical protein
MLFDNKDRILILSVTVLPDLLISIHLNSSEDPIPSRWHQYISIVILAFEI